MTLFPDRRDLLVTALGAAAGAFLPGSVSANAPGAAKAFILIDLFGGPSHIDMFDPKPEAPKEIRGEFSTIATALPGVRVTEHLPEMAKRINQYTLIRTLTHKYNSHNPYGVMTGFDGGQDQTNYFARPTDHPGMGAVCQYLKHFTQRELPNYVCLPAFPGYSQGLRRAGPYGGYLGSQYDPMFSTCEPTWASPIDANKDFYNPDVIPMGDPKLPKLTGDLTAGQLGQRRELLAQLDLSQDTLVRQRRQQAFDLLLAPRARAAFDIERESPKCRDRYGRNVFGSSILMARRLVEVGVPYVMVHTEAKGNGHWDTHNNNFNMLKKWLLPMFDRSISALLDDLDQRGLLDSTLVAVLGDMGRTPKINGAAGRDHWPTCGFCLLFGAGVKRGLVYGASDRQAAYPKDHPVTQGDLTATIYHLLGVDPETTVPDQTGRPIHISHGGRPVQGILT